MLLLALTACGSDAVAWPAATAELSTSASVLTFPATRPGERTIAPLELTNQGGAPVVVAVNATAPFLAERAEVTLGAGGTATLNVLFAPVEWTDASGSLTVDGLSVALAGPVLRDADGDGVDTREAGGSDCDDARADVYPGAADTCGDDVDADCDPVGDDDCDADGAPTSTDCDDAEPEIYPGAPEQTDGVDQDCDGRIDEHLTMPGDLLITEIAPQEPAWIELCNSTTRTIALDGYTLTSAASTADLPTGSVEPGGCVAVCASTVSGCPFTAELVIDPEADGLTVAAESAVDTVHIDRTWAWEPGFVWSLDVGVDADGNDAASAWCRTTGSPGTPNGACP